MEIINSLIGILDIFMLVSIVDAFSTKKWNVVLNEIIFIDSFFIAILSLIDKNYIYFVAYLLIGILWLLMYIRERKTVLRCFDVVVDSARRTNGEIQLPTRATENSMAYDFYANEDYVVKPNEVVKIWTDVKAFMQRDEGLILNVRSSMGGKFTLANTQGWIDSDYYSNETNDGNIGIFLKNISNETQTISKGDKIAQGMFITYLTIGDKPSTKRKGGFGSTDK